MLPHLNLHIDHQLKELLTPQKTKIDQKNIALNIIHADYHLPECDTK
jgi:hypothetical protein